MHKQVEKNHHFKQSMKHAVNGIQTVFQDERNFRFDVVAAIVVVILGFLLKIERLEWYWIVFCIFLMFYFRNVKYCCRTISGFNGRT